MRRLLAAIPLALCVFEGAVAAPTLAGCPIFPADNVWNARVDSLPRDPNSDAYVAAIGSGGLHPDFGAGSWNGGPIGIPFNVVPEGQARVPVSFTYAEESDPGPYPIPPDSAIEGGEQSGGDRHVLVLEQGSCRLYEMWSSYPQQDGSWAAGSGAVFDLTGNTLRPSGWTSADAAGLPILPGLVRYDEVAAGAIQHAIRFTAPRTRNAFVWPARHDASSLGDTRYPPMGQRFRLRADFDISGFSSQTRVILEALKRYGMILADNGSAWYLSGAPDPGWDDDALVSELRGVPGSAFEAVDLSSLMVSPDSAQVRGTAAGGGEALLAQAQAADAERAQFAQQQGAITGMTADRRSFYVAWAPADWNGGVIATLHAERSYAFDEFWYWQPYAQERRLAVVALQWWLGGGDATSDYYSPAEIQSQLDQLLGGAGIAPGATLLHGFSRGAAATYAVAGRDAAGSRRFGLVVANAGGMAEASVYNQQLINDSGPSPLAGVQWMLYCGGRDPDPQLNGCTAMEATRNRLTQLGGQVLLLRKELGAEHDGFMRRAGNVHAALNLFPKATGHSAAETVLNWAESSYPAVLTPSGATSAWADPFWYRCYASGWCTGERGGRIVYYDGHELHDAGAVADFEGVVRTGGGPVVQVQ